MLSVVMAVYNEVHTVGDVIDQVLKVDLDGRLLELVIVESNSTDGTREIVQSYERHPNVRVIYQDRPLGKGFAVRAGLAAAVGDVDPDPGRRPRVLGRRLPGAARADRARRGLVRARQPARAGPADAPLRRVASARALC